MFDSHERLGSGTFGDCFLGTKGGRPIAIKRMRIAFANEKGVKAFWKEVVTLSRIDHVNIVTLIGYVFDPCLLIVMEYVEGGMLSTFIRSQDRGNQPSSQAAMRILVGTARGMEYLHSREPMPVIHRDIKSDNILLTKDLEPRIADFGEARALAKEQSMTIVGTNGYTAPEVLRGQQYVVFS